MLNVNPYCAKYVYTHFATQTTERRKWNQWIKYFHGLKFCNYRQKHPQTKLLRRFSRILLSTIRICENHRPVVLRQGFFINKKGDSRNYRPQYKNFYTVYEFIKIINDLIFQC